MLNLFGVSHKTDFPRPISTILVSLKLIIPFALTGPPRSRRRDPSAFVRGNPVDFFDESQHNEVRMVQGPDAPEPNKDTQNPSVEFYRKIKSSLVISYWTATLPLIRTASNQ